MGSSRAVQGFGQFRRRDKHRRRLAVAEQINHSASRWLHFGLTSSDVIDTAQALQMREKIWEPNWERAVDQLRERAILNDAEAGKLKTATAKQAGAQFAHDGLGRGFFLLHIFKGFFGPI
mgnify:CR=1 FL=1